jgi:hypothetical protein
MLSFFKIMLLGLGFAFAVMQFLQANCTSTQINANSLENIRNKAMTEEKEIPKDKMLDDIRFEANIEIKEDKLLVNYKLTNESKTDIYLMDILPVYEPETLKPKVDYNNSVVILEEPDCVKLIRGIPPYPAEKDMSAFITPYANKIPVGETLNRNLQISLPIVEANPYYAPLDLKKYESVKIKKLKLSVQILRNNVEGFQVNPASFGENVFFVRSTFLTANVKTFRKDFSVDKLNLLKYPETFTR